MKNEFNLHVNEISFSYEKMGTKTRFEEEAKVNSEMAYCFCTLSSKGVVVGGGGRGERVCICDSPSHLNQLFCNLHDL